MKRLDNRADSHLAPQVESDSMGNGAWVNHGYSGSPVPSPQGISTIYSSQPLFQGAVDSMYKLDTADPFPEEPPSADPSPMKKKRGCCSFIKGRPGNPFSRFQRCVVYRVEGERLSRNCPDSTRASFN